MSLLKIIANGIELDFVKETLSVKTENNTLSREFKVSASSYPFLVIENSNTIKALGTRDLASVKKNKITQVIVLEGNNRFYGELQVLTCLNGFRKCNLKYSSIILTLMNKKISEFMPVVSVIPDELDPVPYSEKTDPHLLGSEHWANYPIPFLSQSFPEVKWQFPTMKWVDKFGVGLDKEDDWFHYNNKINEYKDDLLVLNELGEIETGYIIKNNNVVSPQIYLLSPLFYALDSIGFKAIGEVMENEFLKKLLMLSTKDNLTNNNYSKLVFPPLEYDSEFNFWTSIFKVEDLEPGKYTVKYSFQEKTFTGPVLPKSFGFGFNGINLDIYLYDPDIPSKIFEGEVEFEVIGDEIDNDLTFFYSTHDNSMPVYELSFAGSEKQYFQMHPTIQLGRFLPDWTFGTYLNELQNLFNLEIIPDDFAKTIEFKFNETTILNNSTFEIKKSLKIESYDLQPYNAFLLKYDNDEDAALWITTEGTEIFNSQKSDFSDTLKSKFKYIPVSLTADLSESVESKGGIGLMIYDPVNKPYISPDYLGQTLKIDGEKGIYEVFWKKFLKFLINSSSLELSGPFTETEKNKIIQLKRIFIDNQEYMIAFTECKETNQDNFIIKFDLRSITF